MSDNQNYDPSEERDEELENELTEGNNLENVVRVSGMYENWFLDYASYVILERAVPHINDGLKPVQRRILHSMKEMDDGRYHKVANIIGNTMKYHPHGDASIGDALVQLGQKDLLIDTQGNWGNIYTGDRAAAPRYIEARLNKFALEVVFNAKTTEWLASYDGRGKEPETLPVKFPLLLSQGVEGIAVGLACKILPHNVVELIDASIAYLRKKPFTLVPDFPTAGSADFSNYNDGLRGGKVKVRAKIAQLDKKTLIITELPFGTNTSSLIDSILKANDKGKIKIKRIEDNTAENVEILIHLAPNVSPDKTIDALYAFSDCEVSISPNSTVIEDDKPKFLGVTEILKHNTDQTVHLLTRELEIKKSELQESWHFASLEKIFIENRIYRDIEECETWEQILSTIHAGLKPHVQHLIRPVTDDDVTRLTEIKIKRISKFDSFKADEYIARLEAEIDEVQGHLDTIIDYSIEYYKNLKKKYFTGVTRKTEIKSFENIDAAKVAVANEKLYVNYKEGFIGYSLKRGEGEYVSDCSDIDDVIIMRRDCVMVVTRVSQKAFVGKDILYAGIWKKGDKRTIYNLIYQDGPTGRIMMKRFPVTSITRDKEYHLGKETKGSKILYLTANPNGEAEVVNVFLRPLAKLRKLKIEVDFAELAIKGRAAAGNTLTKYPVSKVVQKEKGVSTLAARKIWYDETVNRINSDGRGELLGAFSGENKILTITQDGHYRLTGFELTTHFEDNMVVIEKFNPNKIISCVYFDGTKKQFFIKRFQIEETDKKVLFISENPGSYLEWVSTDQYPMIQLNFKKQAGKEFRDPEEINVSEFIAVKGLKAQGNRLSQYDVKNIDVLESLPSDEPEPEEPETQSSHHSDEDDDEPQQATLDLGL